MSLGSVPEASGSLSEGHLNNMGFAFLASQLSDAAGMALTLSEINGNFAAEVKPDRKGLQS